MIWKIECLQNTLAAPVTCQNLWIPKSFLCESHTSCIFSFVALEHSQVLLGSWHVVVLRPNLADSWNMMWVFQWAQNLRFTKVLQESCFYIQLLSFVYSFVAVTPVYSILSKQHTVLWYICPQNDLQLGRYRKRLKESRSPWISPCHNPLDVGKCWLTAIWMLTFLEPKMWATYKSWELKQKNITHNEVEQASNIFETYALQFYLKHLCQNATNHRHP